MSREQRRAQQKQQTRTGGGTRRGAAAAPPSRRTPVKVAGGSNLPTVPLIVLGGVIIVVGLLAYLIVQSRGESEQLSEAERAEQNDDPDLPGVWYPTQGRGHFQDASGGAERLVGHEMTPFCEGVPQSELARSRSGVPFGLETGSTPGASTPAAEATATNTPSPTVTVTATPTAGAETTGTAVAGGETGETPEATPTVPTDCYHSNPPSSGQHLGVEGGADIGDGRSINIPPDPDVYPPDVEVPRDAIPHILEHAGIFIGYHCVDGDQECQAVVDDLTDLTNDRIDNNRDRIVLAKDLDLPEGEIGVASWTRVMNFPYTEYDRGAVTDFIRTHSYRFDPEGFERTR
jgi:hypothetical protein